MKPPSFQQTSFACQRKIPDSPARDFSPTSAKPPQRTCAARTESSISQSASHVTTIYGILFASCKHTRHHASSFLRPGRASRSARPCAARSRVATSRRADRWSTSLTAASARSPDSTPPPSPPAPPRSTSSWPNWASVRATAWSHRRSLSSPQSDRPSTAAPRPCSWIPTPPPALSRSRFCGAPCAPPNRSA